MARARIVSSSAIFALILTVSDASLTPSFT
jgi:hypothetical protein